EHLEKSIGAGETAEALEDLGLAGWWLDDAELTFGARERSYSLYRDSGDERGAARVAIWLVWDYLAFRGDFAVSSGWMERARRLPRVLLADFCLRTHARLRSRRPVVRARPGVHKALGSPSAHRRLSRSVCGCVGMARRVEPGGERAHGGRARAGAHSSGDGRTSQSATRRLAAQTGTIRRSGAVVRAVVRATNRASRQSSARAGA